MSLPNGPLSLLEYQKAKLFLFTKMRLSQK